MQYQINSKNFMREVFHMRKTIKKVMAMATAATMLLSLAGCGNNANSANSGAAAPAAGGGESQAAAVPAGAGESSLKGQNVRVVIGSTSTSGDSYMIADLVTRYLSAEMGFNGKVDAIGNAAALDEIKNGKGDGKLVMMFHDMTFLSQLFGSVDEMYSLENMTVGPRIGQNPGACFGAAAEDNLATLADVTKYLEEHPGEPLSFNIESGATSHLAFVAYYLYVKEMMRQAESRRLWGEPPQRSCRDCGTATRISSTAIPLPLSSTPRRAWKTS